ncbi:hypothetical protein BPAE_0186g00160 [Botrytis paeoniae]|uniref:VOC domain-containing protein n=1 Tax=Botrytis paeoniae TaxID=278948 RepID=A0A4Z1FC66_9HELO|nr:hypothetical protein BPAE_0186g00160 [Botrytis paeoniae]
MSMFTRSIPKLINHTNLQHIRKMASTPAAHIKSLDHLVLTVASIPRSTQWYKANLNMQAEQFVSSATPDITRHSLLFGSQKINLHQLGKEFEPKAQNVKDGSADLCFITDDNVKDVRQRLIDAGVEMVDLSPEKTDEGIVIRTGAQGKLRSVYCRDPDGNLIEISNYI